jgi:hypothetical protein
MPVYRVETTQGEFYARIEAASASDARQLLHSELSNIPIEEISGTIHWMKPSLRTYALTQDEGYFYQEEGDPYYPLYVVKDTNLVEVPSSFEHWYVVDIYVDSHTESTEYKQSVLLSDMDLGAEGLPALPTGQQYVWREIRDPARYEAAILKQEERWERTRLDSEECHTAQTIEDGLKRRRAALFGTA